LTRIVTIVLAICILFSNTGWAFTTHYCMGERVGMNLEHSGFENDLHECAKCGMKKSSSDNGCCKDEKIIVKASDAATITLANFEITPLWADLPRPMIMLPYDGQSSISVTTKRVFRPHGPPVFSGPPIFLKNCVFLI